MPQIKSAKKRVAQTAKRTTRNNHLKRQIRAANQSLVAAVTSKKAKEVAQKRSALDSLVDRAVKKNLIHKNKGARRKSQAARLAKSVGPQAGSKLATKPSSAKSKEN